MRLLLLLLAFTCWQCHALDEQEMFELSIKELLSVGLEAGKTKGIFFDDAHPPSSDTVNLGLLVPFSTEQQFAVELIAAAEIAAKEINSAGGINGKKLIIVRGDDAARAEDALRLAKQMSSKYNTGAIIGPVQSQSALTVARSVNRPTLILPMANADELTHIDKNDSVYRLTARNSQVAKTIINYIETQDMQRIALVHQKDIFGRELANQLIELIAKSDRKLVFDYEISNIVNYELFDLTEEIENAHATTPDIIIFAILPSKFKHIMPQFQRVWSSQLPKVLLSEKANINSLDLKQIISRHCILAVTPTNSLKDIPILHGIKELLDVSQADYSASYVYDAVYLYAYAKLFMEQHKVNLAEALKNVASGEGKLLTRTTYNIEKFTENKNYRFQGQSGVIILDDNGDNVSTNIAVSPIVSERTSCKN